MKKYAVYITQDAYNDLEEIRAYIAYMLFMPKAAVSYIKTIKETIKKLEYTASAYKAIQEEPFISAGIRRVLAKKFYIYYFIEEKTKCVYVLTIIYAKMNQKNVLSKISN